VTPGPYRRQSWFLILGAGLTTIPAAALAEPKTELAPFAAVGAFAGARIGMSLEAWRALPLPGSRQLKRRCETPAGAPAGVLICRYADIYGAFELPPSVPLDTHLSASRVRYRFVDNRLTAISLRVSVDAYNDLLADLAPTYGAPTRTVVDRVGFGAGRMRARVRLTWTRPAGALELIDPSPDPLRLELRLTS